MGSTKSLRDSQRQNSRERKLQLTGHLHSVPPFCPPLATTTLTAPASSNLLLQDRHMKCRVSTDSELQVTNGCFFSRSVSQAVLESTYTKKLLAADLKLTCNWASYGFIC